jgi:hypothetical protein
MIDGNQAKNKEKRRLLTSDVHVADHYFGVEGGSICRHLAAVLARKFQLYVTKDHLIRPGLAHLQHHTQLLQTSRCIRTFLRQEAHFT